MQKIQELDWRDYASFLKPRPQDTHKGACGHVLIIGGDLGYLGAVLLSAQAAYRVGAGLVRVVAHPQHAYSIALHTPEIVSCSYEALEQHWDELWQSTDVAVIGPGLGRHPWASALVQRVCQEIKKPIVWDADALNILAENNWKPPATSIFTPHPGEAARLLHKTSNWVQENRLAALQTLHRLYPGVMILKGFHTLMMADDLTPHLCLQGNPGMATAGMGDILTGVIAGLLGQGLSLKNAAALGILLHAMAGDQAAGETPRGLIASDLFPFLRQLVNRIKPLK
ncbi:MAG: NAD(P)H-hydrate dehydratase [Legionellaceae bacterium]|nr:NAD(P)H-hydrate dehydratase [Legionellaceae bacterium]